MKKILFLGLMLIQNKKEDFLKLIAAHKLIIYKMCNSYYKNQYNRDDWYKNLFINCGTVKFTALMNRAALNVAITFYRKTKTGDDIIKLAEPVIEIEDNKDDTCELEKNIYTLHQFISELKKLDKALMIFYVEEKAYSEIAKILGITETNVATRISSVNDKPKKMFSTQNN